MSHSRTTIRRTIVEQSRRTTAAMVGTVASSSTAAPPRAAPVIPTPPQPPLTTHGASILASDNPTRTAGARLQLLLVELDEPLPHRSRVAGVFSDGDTMVAAEIDGSALARYVADDYYEGDSLVLDQIHRRTAGSVGLPVISALSAPREMRCVVGSSTYIADPDVHQPSRVLQRERMLLNDPKECCYALSAALFTSTFTVQVVSAPQVVTVNARNMTQVYVTDGNDVALVRFSHRLSRSLCRNLRALTLLRMERYCIILHKATDAGYFEVKDANSLGVLPSLITPRLVHHFAHYESSRYTLFLKRQEANLRAQIQAQSKPTAADIPKKTDPAVTRTS